MGKSAVDISGEIGAIESDLSKADEVAKQLEKRRLERLRKSSKKGDSKADLRPDESQKGKSQEGNAQEDKPDVSPRKDKPTRRSKVEPIVLKDCYVSASFKILQSHRQRLHDLSRNREENDLLPYLKQELMKEAIEYILAKYPMQKKG